MKLKQTAQDTQGLRQDRAEKHSRHHALGLASS